MSDVLLQKLAQLEAEVSALRKGAREPQAPQFDPNTFLRQLVTDPVGTLTRHNLPVDHVTRVLVANAMGDQAPPELKVLAAMGPQVSAQRALAEQVDALSRRLTDLTSPKPPSVDSVKALTADKAKYPHLAKALAADPAFFTDAEIAAGGSAEEFAAQAEARLSKMAAVYAPPPASEANADPNGQSKQAAPADTPVTSGGVPPIPKPTGASFTQEDHVKLRDEIVRKHTSQAAPQ